MASWLLTVFIPVGFHLPFQRDDVIILGVMLRDADPGGFQVGRLDQQRHAAAELALNGPGRRGDAVFDIVPVQKIVQRQSLFIILEQDVPADIGISH